MTETRLAEVVADVGDATPFGERGVGFFISFKHSENHFRDGFAHADCDAGEFRNGTEVVVAELHECCGVFVIHCAARLESDEDDGALHFADDSSEGSAGSVGDHVDEEHIQVCGFDLRKRLIGPLCVVRHSEVGDIDRVRFQLFDEHSRFFVHFLEQSGELPPVGVEPDGEHSDVCVQRFSAFNFHDKCSLLGCCPFPEHNIHALSRERLDNRRLWRKRAGKSSYCPKKTCFSALFSFLPAPPRGGSSRAWSRATDVLSGQYRRRNAFRFAADSARRPPHLYIQTEDG